MLNLATIAANKLNISHIEMLYTFQKIFNLIIVVFLDMHKGCPRKDLSVNFVQFILKNNRIFLENFEGFRVVEGMVNFKFFYSYDLDLYHQFLIIGVLKTEIYNLT